MHRLIGLLHAFGHTVFGQGHAIDLSSILAPRQPVNPSTWQLALTQAYLEPSDVSVREEDVIAQGESVLHDVHLTPRLHATKQTRREKEGQTLVREDTAIAASRRASS